MFGRHLPERDHLVVELVELVEGEEPQEPCAQERMDEGLWGVLVELLNCSLALERDPSEPCRDPADVDIDGERLSVPHQPI